MQADTAALLSAARRNRALHGFRYNCSNNDLFDEIYHNEHCFDDERRHAFLRRVLQQPRALYCGIQHGRGHGSCCCFAHIVGTQDVDKWMAACDVLDDKLKEDIASPIADGNDCQKVLNAIEADGRQSGTTSTEWENTFKWLKQALPFAYKAISPQTKTQVSVPKHNNLINEVIAAANVLKRENNITLRPGQLAAVLINVYSAVNRIKLIIEMKTGEGKTFVCGVSAAVVAKLFPGGPAIILTSNLDNALEGRESTKKFVEAYLGKLPIGVEDLDPTKPESLGAGCVAYGLVSEAQRIVVDALRKGHITALYDFLKKCSFFLDEADHVLIEQAESLLYVASPCRCYHALCSMLFHIQYRLDHDKDFRHSEVKSHIAIKDKATELTKIVMQHIKDHEYSKDACPPPIIDIEICCAQWASGALSARLKRKDKEYVLEITGAKTPGTIADVPMVTIVDLATGTESDGTRWTTEAPFVEAREEIPVNGSDPLAFYSAFPYLLQHVRWFGGITGTVGAAHTLNYYATTYDIRTSFRIPRHVAPTIYRLNTKVALTEETQLNNICTAVDNWLDGKAGLKAQGPVLIIAESIEKATRIVEALEKRGHAIMIEVDEGDETDNLDETDKKEQTNEKNKKENKKSWTVKESYSGTRRGAHIFPFYRRDHSTMHRLPDDAIVVASNKGGRGLDLKLDGSCPKGCNVRHHATHAQRVSKKTPMGSVLYVILTAVLPGRQDEQAVGRCGRSGKGGVVQYQLVYEDDNDQVSSLSASVVDPEVFMLERRLRKDSLEMSDLGNKSKRIEQHRFDGWVLDKFCEFLPVYVVEWMLKLFPNMEPSSTTTTTTGGATEDGTGENPDKPIAYLQPIIAQWFMEYLIQAWSYWRGYGGHRRKPGDFLKYFEHRMGLDGPFDLPEATGDEDALHRFGLRFMRFACILRLSGDDLYGFAKTLLTAPKAKRHPFTIDLCVNILDVASSPVSEVKLLPEGDPWRPEFSGNAALLLAFYSKDPISSRKGLTRAKNALERLLVGFKSDDTRQNTHPYPIQVDEVLNKSKSPRQTFYRVQHAAIVRQLEHRIVSLNPDAITSLKHLLPLLKNDANIEFRSYCYGYEWTKVVFELFVGDSPFTPTTTEQMEAWKKSILKKANHLGSAPRDFTNGSSVGGGNAQVRTEEELSKFEREGESMTELLEEHRQSNRRTSTESESKQAAYTWEPIAPTQDDIKASTTWQWFWVIGFVWAWIVSMFTTPTLSYAGLTPSTSAKKVGEKQGENISETQARAERRLDEIEAEHFRNTKAFSAELAAKYLRKHQAKVSQVVADIKEKKETSDIIQDRADIRTDGTTTEQTTRAEAKSEADEAAQKTVHLKDPDLTDQDKYLVNEMLKVLKKKSTKGQLKGFDEELRQILDAIAQYNDYAMTQSVTQEDAKKMNDAVKEMWRDVLRLALDHGDKIQEMKTPLSNYRNSQKKWVKTVEKVREKVTEFKDKLVDVVKMVGGWVWSGLKWIWGKVKMVVQELRKVPVIKQVVNFVEKTVINPLFTAAEKFFDWVKPHVTEAWKAVCGFVAPHLKRIVQAVRKALAILGGYMAVAFNTFASAFLSYVWEPFFFWVFPTLAWTGSGIWSVLTATGAAIAGTSLWQEFCGILMYFWQGSGDIVNNAVWGNLDFDIIDIGLHKDGISRGEIRRREALRRVWASSWLQLWFDESLLIGLDLDDREHVQSKQEQAHQDYLRARHAVQRRIGLIFSVTGTVIAALFLVASILTGGATLVPGSVFITSLISTYLSFYSANVDTNRDLTSEDKETQQSVVSIVQTLLLILSVGTALLFPSSVSNAVIAGTDAAIGTGMQLLGVMLQRFSTFADRIVKALRARQQWRTMVQQVDKLFRAVGLKMGGAIRDMDIKGRGLRMAAVALSTLGVTLQMSAFLQKFKNKLKNQQEEEQREQQERDRSEEEDEQQNNNRGEKSVTTNLQKRTLKFKDGSKLEQRSAMSGAAATSQSGSAGKCIQGRSESYRFTSKKGQILDVIVKTDYSIKPPTKKDKDDPMTSTVQFFRNGKETTRLTADEKTLFKGKSSEELQAMFDSKSKHAFSDHETTLTSTDVKDSHGRLISRKTWSTSVGTIKSTFNYASGKRQIILQPTGHPNPKPVVMKFEYKTEKFSQDGELGEPHKELLRQHFDVEDDSALPDLSLKRDNDDRCSGDRASGDARTSSTNFRRYLSQAMTAAKEGARNSWLGTMWQSMSSSWLYGKAASACLSLWAKLSNTKAFQAVGAKVSNAQAWVTEKMSRFWHQVSNSLFRKKVASLWNSTTSTVGRLWTGTRKLFGNTWRLLSQAWHSFVAAAGTVLKVVLWPIAKLWEYVSAAISAVWRMAKHVLSKLWEVVKFPFVKLWQGLSWLCGAAFAKVRDAFAGIMTKTVRLLSFAARKCRDSLLEPVWNRVKTIVVSRCQGAWQWLSQTSLLRKVASSTKNVINHISDSQLYGRAAALASNAWKWVSWCGAQIGSGLSTFWNTIRSMFQGTWNMVISTLTSPVLLLASWQCVSTMGWRSLVLLPLIQFAWTVTKSALLSARTSRDTADAATRTPADLLAIKAILYFDLQRRQSAMDTGTFNAHLSKLRAEENMHNLMTNAQTAITNQVGKYHSGDEGVRRSVEQLLGKLHQDPDFALSTEQWHQFDADVERVGYANAFALLLDQFARVTKEAQKMGVRSSTDSNSALYDRLSELKAGYSRENTRFVTTVPQVEWSSDAQTFIKRVRESTKSKDVEVTGQHQVIAADKLKSDIESFIRKGDLAGLFKYIQRILNVETPWQFSTVPGLEGEFDRIVALEKREIMHQLLTVAKYAWGQVRDKTVADATNKLVSQLVNSVQNVRLEWTSPTCENKITAVNVRTLEAALNYKSDNKRNGHVQEALIAISFNNEAAKHSSPFRLQVNEDTKATGGRDLLLIDTRTGKEIGNFESKRYTSSAAKSNFKKHTNPESKKYYVEGTIVLVNEEKRAVLQEAFPMYTFKSVLEVPDTADGRGGSIQLGAGSSDTLMEKITSLQPGEKFYMQGPRGSSASGNNIVDLQFSVDEHTRRFAVTRL